ncbi:glycosyltransferase [Flavobacterium sp.]|uniref:glycosyltransferase n=1 Tax=Flavobacterium sp. TaxID=239 RepID=UPI00286BA7D3|nr:glycosyltransferase [Flavobacterium sp.]
MRVLQIIDSLDAGGAERMAVNFANALYEKIEFSGIVVTRNEGVLKSQLHKNVPYFYLNKRKTIDLKSIKVLKETIIQNKIEVLHAHGTSFFTVFLLKMVHFKIKIIYHEHYGNRALQSKFKNIPLIFCLLFFNKIVVVNHQVKDWFINVGFKKIILLSNFASFDENIVSETKLFGQDNKRIISLANLKNPKNHILLLKAFQSLNLKDENWSLHFVGKIFNNDYSKQISNFVDEFNLNDFVYLYDIKSDIKHILSQATIGVLCSTNEGFPVTLLEYGLANLPVICSNVGFCGDIIINKQTGLLFENENVKDLSLNLKNLVSNMNLRKSISINLNEHILNNFSQEKTINDLIHVYNQ